MDEISKETSSGRSSTEGAEDCCRFHHEPRTTVSLLIYKGCTLIKLEWKQEGRGQAQCLKEWYKPEDTTC